jgi:hypothetical protein
MGTVKKAFTKRLASALDEVSAAEKDLAELLRRIRVAPRAQKTTISATVEDALSRLRIARTNLVDLQKLVRESDD